MVTAPSDLICKYNKMKEGKETSTKIGLFGQVNDVVLHQRYFWLFVSTAYVKDGRDHVSALQSYPCGQDAIITVRSV